LESAAAGAKTEDDLRDAIEDSLTQLDGVVATFNAVLRLSRLEAGEGGQLEPLDASGLLVQLADMFEPVVDDKGLVFTAEIAADLNMMADKSLLAQALSNMLDNAVKYTQAGQIILGGKRTDAGEIELFVCDSGMGIPAASRAQVTERFARLDAARSLPGTGIGLSLALAISELHQGRFELTDGIVHDSGTGLRASIIIPARA
jgi:signal transduction histidine kinase